MEKYYETLIEMDCVWNSCNYELYYRCYWCDMNIVTTAGKSLLWNRKALPTALSAWMPQYRKISLWTLSFWNPNYGKPVSTVNIHDRVSSTGDGRWWDGNRLECCTVECIKIL